MKISLFFGVVAATVVAVSPVFAQPKTAGETQAEMPGVAAPYVDPTTQVSAFFDKLVEGRVDAAYESLLKGTKIAERPKDVATLVTKTREAMRAFGSLDGYEIAKVTNVGRGTHLMCMTCISLGKSFPIRWRFYFYNPTFKVTHPAGQAEPYIVNGVWRLIDIRIDDRLMDMFEESAPAAGSVVK